MARRYKKKNSNFVIIIFIIGILFINYMIRELVNFFFIG